MRKNLLVKTAVALALAAPLLASAESQFVVGGTSAASAKLDFRVVIPRVLFLGVGTGAGAATLNTTGTVDMLTFDYTTNPNAIGTGAAAGTISNTGTLPAGSTFPVRVFGNNGQITLGAVGTDLTNGSGDSIVITQITGNSSVATLPIPAPGASVTLPVSKVTDQTANWTFSYANAAVVPAGTYNGQITYTASMP